MDDGRHTPGSGDGLVAIGFTSLFAMFFLIVPLIRRSVGRPFTGAAAQAEFAGPLLLAAFPALAAIEPAFVEPWPSCSRSSGSSS